MVWLYESKNTNRTMLATAALRGVILRLRILNDITYMTPIVKIIVIPILRESLRFNLHIRGSGMVRIAVSSPMLNAAPEIATFLMLIHLPTIPRFQ